MRSVPHMAALHRKMVKHIPSQADMHDFSVSTVKDHINLGCLATVIGNSTTTDLKLHIQIQQMKV